MYTPPYTRWDDRAAALRLVQECNFGELITIVDGAPLVTHLPFLVDAKRNVLRGHVARANPHGGQLDGNVHMAVFKGPYAYISPDWYGEASEDVPTWNYLAVHVSGRGRVIADERAVDAFLAELSAFEEQRRPDIDRGGKIWTMDKVAAKDHVRMRAAILAFEIGIDKIEAKAKLNQNKPPEAIAGVVKALAESGAQMSEYVAGLMKEFNSKK